jgi:Ca2+-binding EF-hand superfamily protein
MKMSKNFRHDGKGLGMTTASDSPAQIIAKYFDWADVSHDGVLTDEDGMKTMEELFRRFGCDPDSPEASRIRQAREQLWQSMLAAVDKDNDGKITRDEYITYYTALPLEEHNQSIELYAETVFELADSDDNEQLTKEEFTLSHQHISGQTVDDIFTRYDRDGDGVLSKAEYLECMRNFMAA